MARCQARFDDGGSLALLESLLKHDIKSIFKLLICNHEIESTDDQRMVENCEYSVASDTVYDTAILKTFR